MNNGNVLMLLLVLICGNARSTMAQDKTPRQITQQERAPITPEKRAELQTYVMAERLKLSHQQKTALYEVNLEAMKEMQVMFEQRALAQDKDKIKAIQETRDQKLKAILTEEQYKQLTELKHSAPAPKSERQ